MNTESIVAYYNGLPPHFKGEGVLMVLNPHSLTLHNVIDHLSHSKKYSNGIDLVSKNNYDISHHAVFDTDDQPIINLLKRKFGLCFKKMYDEILSGKTYLDFERGKGDLIWYKGALFAVPFNTIPLSYTYEPVELVTEYRHQRERKLIRVKVYTYESIKDYIPYITKSFKRKLASCYTKNCSYMVETLAITDGGVSSTYLRPVKSIDCIQENTGLVYYQDGNILYIDYEKSFDSDCVNDIMNNFLELPNFDEE